MIKFAEQLKNPTFSHHEPKPIKLGAVDFSTKADDYYDPEHKNMKVFNLDLLLRYKIKTDAAFPMPDHLMIQKASRAMNHEVYGEVIYRLESIVHMLFAEGLDGSEPEKAVRQLISELKYV